MPEDVLDLLASLVEKSLVTLDETRDGAALQDARDHTGIRRSASWPKATTADATAHAHCEYYFGLTKQARDGIRDSNRASGSAGWKQISKCPKRDRAVAVGRGRSIHRGEDGRGPADFWILRGYATEGRGIVRAALESPAIRESDVAQAWALYVGAGLAESQSDHAEARRMLEACLELRRRLGNQIDIAATLSTLSLARLQAGDISERRAERTGGAAYLSSRSANKLRRGYRSAHLGQIYQRAGKEERRSRPSAMQCLSVAKQIREQGGRRRNASWSSARLAYQRRRPRRG